jgi:hypothetical protein
MMAIVAFGWIQVVVVVAIAALLPFVVVKNRMRLLGAYLSYGGALLLAAAATVALTLAVLLPEKSLKHFADWLGFESGHEMAAAPWVRWALVVIAVILVVVPRLWRRPVWPDVAVALLLTIGIYAAVKEHHKADTPKGESPPPTVVTFTLPKAQVTTLNNVGAGESAVLLVVSPKTVTDGTTVNYDTHRYEGTRVGCETGKDVCVSVERGSDDAAALKLSADLESAKRIYLLPASG